MAKRISDVLSRDDVQFMIAHRIDVPTMLETEPEFGNKFDVMYESLEDLELANLGVNYESTSEARHANDILNKLAVF